MAVSLPFSGFSVEPITGSPSFAPPPPPEPGKSSLVKVLGFEAAAGVVEADSACSCCFFALALRAASATSCGRALRAEDKNTNQTAITRNGNIFFNSIVSLTRVERIPFAIRSSLNLASTSAEPLHDVPFPYTYLALRTLRQQKGVCLM